MVDRLCGPVTRGGGRLSCCAATTASPPTTWPWWWTTAAQGIGEVVRGDDLLLLHPPPGPPGRPAGHHRPGYAHVPLVLGPDGRAPGQARRRGHPGRPPGPGRDRRPGPRAAGRQPGPGRTRRAGRPGRAVRAGSTRTGCPAGPGCGAQRLAMMLRPSPTASITQSTRASATTWSLKARSATVSSEVSVGVDDAARPQHVVDQDQRRPAAAGAPARRSSAGSRACRRR